MKPTRQISPSGTYFVTFSTWQRCQLFVVENYARLFLKVLYGYRREEKYRLHAFILMPEHVHLLITPRGITLERTVQLIKGGYSRAFGLAFRSGEVWHRGFTDHRIRNAEDFANHREYISRNPVQRMLVQNSAEYRYGSDFPGYRLDRWPPAAEAASTQALVRHD